MEYGLSEVSVLIKENWELRVNSKTYEILKKEREETSGEKIETLLTFAGVSVVVDDDNPLVTDDQVLLQFTVKTGEGAPLEHTITYMGYFAGLTSYFLYRPELEKHKMCANAGKALCESCEEPECNLARGWCKKK